MTTTLTDAIIQITPDPYWAIYAKTPFNAHTDARIGQANLKNRGVLDSMVWVGNGDSLYERSLPDPETCCHEEWDARREEHIIEVLIPELEAERLENNTTHTWF